jgi:two-component system, LytTR family, response regulator
MTRELRVLIVDDEPLARRGIRQLVERRPGFVVIGESRNGREALRAIDSAAPDLVFLDVQMPELDGFGVIRARGADRMPAVVFVTAYDAYAVRAFEAHAVDYLVKPVTEARFDAALARVRERLDARHAVEFAQRLQALIAETNDGTIVPRAAGSAPRKHRLVVPTPTGDLVLDAAEIDWIGADDYYAEVYAGGRRHLLRESLTSLAARLEASHFVRVHRSAIVNVDRVRELRSVGDAVVVVLRDGTEVPVSRRHREMITSALRRIHRAP